MEMLSASASAVELEDITPEENGNPPTQTDGGGDGSLIRGIIKFQRQNASHMSYRRREVRTRLSLTILS